MSLYESPDVLARKVDELTKVTLRMAGALAEMASYDSYTNALICLHADITANQQDELSKRRNAAYEKAIAVFDLARNMEIRNG